MRSALPGLMVWLGAVGVPTPIVPHVIVPLRRAPIMARVHTNELTTLLWTVAFFNEDGVPATPTSATYRIDDEGSRTAILAETAIGSLSTSVTIEVTSAQQAMINANTAKEQHVLTVEWNYGTGRHGSDEVSWDVKNLEGVS